MPSFFIQKIATLLGAVTVVGLVAALSLTTYLATQPQIQQYQTQAAESPIYTIRVRCDEIEVKMENRDNYNAFTAEVHVTYPDDTTHLVDPFTISVPPGTGQKSEVRKPVSLTGAQEWGHKWIRWIEPAAWDETLKAAWGYLNCVPPTPAPTATLTPAPTLTGSPTPTATTIPTTTIWQLPVKFEVWNGRNQTVWPQQIDYTLQKIAAGSQTSGSYQPSQSIPPNTGPVIFEMTVQNLLSNEKYRIQSRLIYTVGSITGEQMTQITEQEWVDCEYLNQQVRCTTDAGQNFSYAPQTFVLQETPTSAPGPTATGTLPPTPTLTVAPTPVCAQPTPLEASIHFTDSAVCGNAEAQATATTVDVNGDGQVDGADVSVVVSAWGSQAGDDNYNLQADLDNDGKVGALDGSMILSAYGG